jgi:hypothetical protein
MGATASSRREAAIVRDIRAVKRCLADAQTPIDWSREESMLAHTICNTLENALYHIKSSRGARGMMVRPCTSLSASRREVSFDPRPAADMCSRLGCYLTGPEQAFLLVRERVPTGLPCARPTQGWPDFVDHVWSRPSSQCSTDVKMACSFETPAQASVQETPVPSAPAGRRIQHRLHTTFAGPA